MGRRRSDRVGGPSGEVGATVTRVVTSDDPASVNARFWDALAEVHGGDGDRYYDLDALVAGGSSLSDVEEAAASLGAPSPCWKIASAFGFTNFSVMRSDSPIA